MTPSPDTLFTFWFEETALAGELDRWRVTTGEEAEFLQQSGARF